MNAAAKFGVSLRSLGDTALGVPELLPSRLATAAVAALDGVDAAGISLFADELRVPIGTSDTAAAVAQALQFSVGDGPCFAAHRDQNAVVADHRELAERWPAFALSLMAQTPYQAVVSVPLTAELARLGTFDLYFRRALPPQRVAIEDASLVVGLASVVLSADRGREAGPAELPGPAWLDTSLTARRWLVPVASGMLAAHTHQDFPDTLALLQARAAAKRTTVDDLAQRIVQRTMPLSSLID